MYDFYEDFEYKGYTIRAIQDAEIPESPREFDCNLGTMLCLHGKYNLGDKHNLEGEEIEELYYSKDQISLPLYLYDHSGITMRTSSFSCPWDSGQVGIITVSKEKIKREFNWKNITKKREKQIKDYLESEVCIYDDYLTGNVYGFKVLAPNEEDEFNELDSCWGYYGYDHEKSGLMEQAKSFVDYHVEEQRKAKQHRVKELVKNKVPLEHRVALVS